MPLTKKLVEKVIRENISDPNFCVKKLISILNVSRSYLYDFVNENYGVGLQRLIETYRLDKAIDLISDGVKFRDVCRKCGYLRMRTFRGAFKRRLGISPSEFKRKLDDEYKRKFVVQRYKKILWSGMSDWVAGTV